MGLPKGKLVFQPSIFRGYVRFREGTQINSHVIFSVLKPSNQVTRWKTPTLHRRLHHLLHRWHRWRLHQVVGRGKEETTILTNMFLQLAFWNHHLVDHILKCFFLRGELLIRFQKVTADRVNVWLRGGFKGFYFHPYLEKWSNLNLTSIFFNWVGTKPARFPGNKKTLQIAVLLVNHMVGQPPSSQWNAKWRILGSRNLPKNAWKVEIDVPGAL